MAKLLDEELFQKLKNNDCSLLPLSHQLLNKHIFQLLNWRKESDATWKTYVEWLRLLQPGLIPDGDDWSKRLCAQSKKFLSKRTSLYKAHRQPHLLQEWNDQNYTIPAVTGSKAQVAPEPTMFEMTVIQEQNQRLEQENKELKQRMSPHSQNLQKRRESYSKKELANLRKTKMNLEKEFNKIDNKRQKLSDECQELRANCRSKDKELTYTTECAVRSNEILISQLNEMEKKCECQAERIKELCEYNAEIKTELENIKGNIIRTMHVGENGKMCYKPEVRTCIYKLLNFHISFENVSPVISTVLEMLDKSADNLPSARTVSYFNEERLLISQKQLDILAEKENLTLGTDETPKSGDVYMTYTINDDQQNSYILGLREMVSKSADDTLATLKTVLSDISDICSDTPENNNEKGMQILAQIKNTMSDRASTESKFNDLLESYRSECLPKCVKEWNSFSAEAKDKLKSMNNFFCGLHMLISMAETISESFKQFEDIHLDGNKVGAPQVSGVNVYGTDSGTVRLVRTSCKALAKGADEKNGMHRQWSTYMKNAGINKRYLQNFRGNRFNIVFLLGGCVFHLRQHIWDFLNSTVGQTNGLLKAVHADIQENTFLAGCKVLGLLNKLITAPLWRVIEAKGHIMDLCDVYSKMDKYFDECLDSDERLMELVCGETSCFEDDLISKDEVFDTLKQPWKHDKIVMSMMRHTLGALKLLICRVNHDYLPGGQFYMAKDSEPFLNETLSVPKHNKLPERVFGYLDFLIRKRPNCTAIANEAQVMFVFNKTATFINAQNPQQMKELIKKVSGQNRKNFVDKMKARQKERHNELVRKQEEKKAKIETAKLNLLKRKENLTSIIIDAGLWQTREKVISVMDSIPNTPAGVKERHTALKNQIRFRREILHQYIDGDKKFFFTDNNKPKPWKVLQTHLFKFIDAALSVKDGQSVEKTVGKEESISIPLLVGKKVIHWMDNDNERTPYNGKVISQVPGFPNWFNIVYTDEDDTVYSYKLVEDYREGNLEIIPEN